MLHVQDHTICKQKCFTSFFQTWMSFVSFSCLIALARTKAFSTVRVDISVFCFLNLSIYFWLLGPCCCMGFSLGTASVYCSLAAVGGLLLLQHSMGLRARGLRQSWRVGSVAVAPGLQNTSSIGVVHGLNCSTACGIFPNQGSNPCLLYWQADSLPLSYQGSPGHLCLIKVMRVDILVLFLILEGKLSVFPY